MSPQRANLRELAGLFLRLGATAFGGPAAHIAMMESEVVRRKKWLSREEYLDLLGATHLIPGPNSTEMAIHVGYRRAGWRGIFVAGTCFILPAALIVTLIAQTYVEYESLPVAEAVLSGVKPVMIAVVAQALVGLGRSAIQGKLLAATFTLAAALRFFDVHSLLTLFLVGISTLILRSGNQKRVIGLSLASGGILLSPTAAVAAAVSAAGFSLSKLFLFFLKVGSVLFGSGYVLLAFLRSDLVNERHWLTEAQLLDAIAVGQVTPGPVFTTATFIGYLLAGAPGALIATLGIFLPAFFFVAISAPHVSKWRRSPWAAHFLDGVNVASLVLLAEVTFHLAKTTITDSLAVILALLSALFLFRYRLNSAWLVLLGAGIGLLRFL